MRFGADTSIDFMNVINVYFIIGWQTEFLPRNKGCLLSVAIVVNRRHSGLSEVKCCGLICHSYMSSSLNFPGDIEIKDRSCPVGRQRIWTARLRD